MTKILPISRKRNLTEEEIANSIPYPEDSPTPSQMKRTDCEWEGSPRPCPLVSCRHNNYLTVTEGGRILLTWPDRQPEDVPPQDSCSLDVANRGQTIADPMTFRDLAPIMGCTYQNVQQLLTISHRRARLIADEEDSNDTRTADSEGS